MLRKRRVYLLIHLLWALALLVVSSGCKSATQAEPTATVQPTLSTIQTTDKTGALTFSAKYLDNGKPISQQIFMLAEMRLAQGQTDVFLPVLNEISAPKAESSTDGLVIINNIKPGKYAVTMFVPAEMVMPNDSNNKSIIVDIVAGQVVDLGELKLMVDSKLFTP